MKTILIFFCCINAVSSFFVISLNNPVYSVLFLILTFINSSILTFTIGHEFLAYALLIVYVGAIAILFLFIVMMLDIKSEVSFFNKNYLFFPLGLIFFFIFLNQLYLAYRPFEGNLILYSDIDPINLLNYLFDSQPVQNANWYLTPEIYLNKTLNYINWLVIYDNILDISSISFYIYKEYALTFILTGFILLIAMIGAIILTINLNFNAITTKVQFLARQTARNSVIREYIKE